MHIDDRNAKRWRNALARLGPAFVRNRLDTVITAKAPETEVREIVDEPPHPSRNFVEGWYAETLCRLDYGNTLRRTVVLAVLALAATAAVLAVVFG